MLRVRVVRSDHPALAGVGAVAARRGDCLLVVVSTLAPHRVQTAAVTELLTDAEWEALMVTRRAVAS